MNDKHEGKNLSIDNFSKNKNCWIIDSRAKYHVSCSLENFLFYDTIVPIIVKLPNGNHVNATHKGTIKIVGKMFLQDILYIPNFSYNLISISKLAFSYNLKLIIFSKSYTI